MAIFEKIALANRPVLAAALVGLLAIVWFRRRSSHHPSFLNLHCPASSHWLTGNVTDYIGIGAGVKPQAWHEQFGHTIRVRVALGAPALVTMDPKAISYITQNAYTFPKQKPLRRQLARHLDNGVTVAEGEAHRRQRKMFAPSFSPSMIRNFGDIFQERAVALRDKISRLLDDCNSILSLTPPTTEDEAGGGRKVDVLKFAMEWSMDVIGRAGFDHNMGGLDDVHDKLADSFAASVRDFSTITPMWIIQSMVPFFDYIPNPVTRRMIANKKKTQRICREVYQEKRRDVLAEGYQAQLPAHKLETNLLSSLPNMAQDVDERDRLSEPEVVAQISTLLLAGEANAAFVAAWCLFELSRRPDIQRRLREELKFLPETLNPKKDELASLTLLNAVIREVLRLHPTIPQTMRSASVDSVIPLATPIKDVDGRFIDYVKISKGTTLVIPIIYANRSKEYWGHDAMDFNPDRFMDRDEKKRDFSGSAGVWGNQLSFLDGPRSCLGYRFAVAELRYVVAILIRHFSFEELPSRPTVTHRFAVKNHSVVVGEEHLGMQMPLLVKEVNELYNFE